MKKVELLAPAGCFESLKAAVECGADAVYIGNKNFSARSYANNFDKEDLKEAVDYAHVKNAKIYLAMNTLIYDCEITEALENALYAYNIGVDALIVQDIGFASLLNQFIPDFPLHASTQMTVSSYEGINFLSRHLNIKRVVLSRELSLAEIENIVSKNSDNIEIEIFIHGALCFSYSGQCLFSSIIGKRSGNRGKCAQPCRLPYKIINNEPKVAFNSINSNNNCYWLSLKDLNTINMLDKIIATGVSSLKIEGRMKSPEYVGMIVKTYRKYIDKLYEKSYSSENLEEHDLKNIIKIFNRGFSNGYFTKTPHSEMITYEKPNNKGICLGKIINIDKSRCELSLYLFEDLSLGDLLSVTFINKEFPFYVNKISIDSQKYSSAKSGDIVYINAPLDLLNQICKNRSFQSEIFVYKVFDIELTNDIRNSLLKENKKLFICGKFSIDQDSSTAIFEIWNKKLDIYISKKYNLKIEKAKTKSLSKQRIKEQLLKTGSTEFTFTSLEVLANEDIWLSISDINSIRRNAVQLFKEALINKYKKSLYIDFANEIKIHFDDKRFKTVQTYNNNNNNINNNINISLQFLKYSKNIDYKNLNLENINRLFIGEDFFADINTSKIVENWKSKGIEIYLSIPAPIKNNFYEIAVSKKISSLIEYGIDGVLVGNWELIDVLKKFKNLKIICDTSCNIFNKFSSKSALEMGIDEFVPSWEINFSNLSQIAEHFSKKICLPVYAHIPLMKSQICLYNVFYNKTKNSNHNCYKYTNSEPIFLLDRKNKMFPIITGTDCINTIFNSDTFFILDEVDTIKNTGIISFMLAFLNEDKEYIENIVKLSTDVLIYGSKKLELYKEILDKIKAHGYTKGHFSRGVL